MTTLLCLLRRRSDLEFGARSPRRKKMKRYGVLYRPGDHGFGSVTAAGAASIALQQATAARPYATNGTALPQHLSSTGAMCTNQHQQITSLGGTVYSCL